MSAEDLQTIAARALGVAKDAVKKEGKPDADIAIDVYRNDKANVRFARNEATTAGESSEPAVYVRIAFGQRHAVASSNQTDEASLAALAARAASMAKLSPEDPERMPLLPAQTYAATPPAWDDALATMDPKTRSAITGRAVAKGDAAKVQISGFFERLASDHVLQTSSGLSARHRETSANYTVTARTSDGTGSGWGGREAHRAADIEDEVLTTTAIEKATRSAGAKPLPPGKYTVILEPQAVYELLSFMVGQMDQRSADEGRSFFAGKVGQKLFPDFVAFKSDPSDPATPGSAFDGDGLPLKAHPWIDGGKVAKLGVSRYWAKKKGLEPTGHHSVFHLAGGNAASIDELVKGTKRGLLVTRFWYNRMLEPQSIMVTGLTRDGVFLVENGKVTAPVANFRYNESPITMLKNVEAMTKATTRVIAGNTWHVPGLRTRDFTMASPSAAV